MTCVFCDKAGGEEIWRDDSLRVVWADEPGHPAFVRVIWNDHVREMTDLAAADREHLMRVVLAAETALRQELQPDKVNLASLGNVTPHLHWHVIGRWQDDSHFPDPVWSPARREAPPRAVDRARVANRLRTLLSGGP